MVAINNSIEVYTIAEKGSNTLKSILNYKYKYFSNYKVQLQIQMLIVFEIQIQIQNT